MTLDPERRMSLRVMLLGLRDKTGMYLEEGLRLNSVVDMVVGWGIASGDAQLRGFHEWYCDQAPDRPRSISWNRTFRTENYPHWPRDYSTVPQSESEKAAREVLGLMLRWLDEQPG